MCRKESLYLKAWSHPCMNENRGRYWGVASYWKSQNTFPNFTASFCTFYLRLRKNSTLWDLLTTQANIFSAPNLVLKIIPSSCICAIVFIRCVFRGCAHARNSDQTVHQNYGHTFQKCWLKRKCVSSVF